ncbi:lig_chan-Glu_bd domain-containing protein [Caerostris darwini]|uniref:Lig_chan-Glu_bd domain-containing protein n=1 Tax=Caerostris darwini TaxID=1538125 RepID=A0AAV4WNT8_9ARAC|nr:lig_chan-Glu_bd domain-containing protein [Caerostris darwini]
MKVAVLTVKHVLEINKTTNGRPILSGFDGLFLQLVLNALNVDYEIVIPADGEWGLKKPDGNWTGLIGMMTRREADMTHGSVVITKQRTEVVDFSRPCTVYGETFVIENPGIMISNYAYLYPFDFTTWICSFCVFIIMSVLVFIIANQKVSLHQIFFEMYGNIMKQPLIIYKEFLNWNLLICLWFGFVFVMTLGYSACLSSFLTVPYQKDTVKTFRQLSTAIQKGTHRAFVTKGNFIAEYLAASEEPYLRIIGDKIISKDWFFDILDSGSGKYVNYKYVEIESRPQLEVLYGGQRFGKKFIISKEDIGMLPLGFVIKNNFCCIRRLNAIISRIDSSGLSLKLLKDSSMMASISSEKELSETDEIKPLSFQKMYGCFLVFFIGISSSLIIFILEFVSYHFLRKKTNFIGLVKRKFF